MAKKGSRLSLYDRVYRELDSTNIGAENQRNVPGTQSERYNFLDEIGIDGDYIVIYADNRKRLDFAEKVAQYYNAKYSIIEELWRRDPGQRYKIKINVME